MLRGELCAEGFSVIDLNYNRSKLPFLQTYLCFYKYLHSSCVQMLNENANSKLGGKFDFLYCICIVKHQFSSVCSKEREVVVRCVLVLVLNARGKGFDHR